MSDSALGPGKAKVIRDPVHGDVFLTDLEMSVVDSPEFQRLRRIKQLGMTHLVYPSANHTRFEHSIGALHLAGRIADKLELAIEEKSKIRMAALLHDLGHGPLSHTSEELLERYMGMSHEEITMDVVHGAGISNRLMEGGLKPEEIGELILGRGGYLGKLISSEFDVDRMDFLVRDAHHTGVAYGVIDLDRLVNTLQIFEDSIVITEGGLRAVEALMVARFLMTPTVYLHHASRIADAMFLRAMERAVSDGLVDYRSLYEMDDYDAMCLLRGASGYAEEMGARLDTRKLFKRAYIGEWRDVKPQMREALLNLRQEVSRWRALEVDIAGECGLEEGYLILDIPPLPAYQELETLVVKDGEVFKIKELSPLMDILMDAQKSQWSFGVYTPRENVEKVSQVCEQLESYLI